MYIKLLLDKLRVLEKYSQHLSTFIDLPFKRRQYSIYILENTYIHVISKLGNISFYPHKKKKLLKLNKVHRKGEKICILSSISTTSCFYVHKKYQRLLNIFQICTYVCLFVLGLEYMCYYCLTAVAAFVFKSPCAAGPLGWLCPHHRHSAQ